MSQRSDLNNGVENNKKGSTLNPNAKPFVFNPSAKEFVPLPKQIINKDEIDARLEAVVEILNDSEDQYGDEQYDEQNNNINHNNINNNDEQIPTDNINDDELIEMLEMQKECQLEMMKYYIQSNNPALFEQVYNEVSYADTEESSNFENDLEHQHQHHQQQEGQLNNAINNLTISSSSSSPPPSIDFLKANLNPYANEFVPKKFSN